MTIENLKKDEWKETPKSFLEQIEEVNPKIKGMMDAIFEEDKKLGKDSKNLEQWFKYFLEHSKTTDKIKAKNELLKCENEDDVRKFIEDHQGVRVASTITEGMEEEAARANADKAEAEKDKAEKEKQQRNAEITKNYKITQEKQKELLAKYPGLQEKASEKYKEEENKLKSSGKIEQLKEIARDINDNNFVENYISIQATLQELKNNKTIYEESDISLFDKMVKSLDNACNIADTTLDSFSSENIANTSRELFHDKVWNQSLIEARKDNMELHKGVYDELFSKEILSPEELINKYGWLLLQDSEVPQKHQRWLDFFRNDYLVNPDTRENIKKMNEIPEAYKELYWNYNDMISALERERGKVKDKTKDMIEEMCLITQVNWMMKCIWQESWEFTFNKAKEIKMENGSMVLDWHIDGMDFSVRHNATQEWSPLQVSSRLIKSEDGNSFEIWNKDKKEFKNSPFTLPGQDLIFNMITDIVSTSINSTERIETTDTYIENMQKNITWKVDEIYDNKDVDNVQKYMKDKVQWEKIVDGSLWLIQRIKSDIDFTKPINQTENGEMFNFMKILNYNIDNSTVDEKLKFNRCINEIENITNNYKTNKKSSGLYSSEISQYLENDIWLDTRENGVWPNEQESNQNEIWVNKEESEPWLEGKEIQDQRLWLIYKLFTHFNERENSLDSNNVGYQWDWTPTKLIINDLYQELHDKPKETKEQQARDEQTSEDQAAADEVLDVALAWFPPSPEAPSIG